MDDNVDARRLIGFAAGIQAGNSIREVAYVLERMSEFLKGKDASDTGWDYVQILEARKYNILCVKHLTMANVMVDTEEQAGVAEDLNMMLGELLEEFDTRVNTLQQEIDALSAT